jgi:3' terminal RNA ribose 2'-O-methyltransferase Hen1
VLRVDRRARRRAAVKRELAGGGTGPGDLGQTETSTALHEERLTAVTRVLLESGVRTVLDLGCGSGALLQRLVAEEQFTAIIGVDTSPRALLLAERLLASEFSAERGRLSLRCISFTDAAPELEGFDAAALVETIEHVPPAHLSQVERAVFSELRPSTVVITTPNHEYNVLYGLAAGEFRHPDHQFEWKRPRFQAWAGGVAERNGYRATFGGVGPSHPWLGSPTQMGVFRLHEG